jgi:hypothetical protein
MPAHVAIRTPPARAVPRRRYFVGVGCRPPSTMRPLVMPTIRRRALCARTATSHTNRRRTTLCSPGYPGRSAHTDRHAPDRTTPPHWFCRVPPIRPPAGVRRVSHTGGRHPAAARHARAPDRTWDRSGPRGRRPFQVGCLVAAPTAGRASTRAPPVPERLKESPHRRPPRPGRGGVYPCGVAGTPPRGSDTNDSRTGDDRRGGALTDAEQRAAGRI